MADNVKKQNKTKLNLFISSIIFILAMSIFAIVVISKVMGVPPSLFGFSFHIVVTDSMSPEINVKDFVLAKKVDSEDIKVGDYIVFKSPDEKLKGILILHMVEDIIINDGQRYFQTIGLKEGASTDPFLASEVYGKYIAKSTFVGKLFSFLANPINWTFLIFIFIMLYVIIRLVKNTIKLVKEEAKNADKK